jgi:transposase
MVWRVTRVVDRSPRLLPISLEAQLMVGSFEHALDVLIDDELELSAFERWYCNDETGAPAYDPAVMLKIVLLAYSKGVVSSRAIETLCRENVVFMAISGDSAPQFTTIAKFVRTLAEDVADVFARVLLVCDRLGLIGRQMFAIDGVKLPSNADKRHSGTHAELLHDAQPMDAAVEKMIAAHCEDDESIRPRTSATDRIERLQGEARRIRAFLAIHAERRSARGSVRKSNVTDNESAKMATQKGVIQGYTAVAAVDEQAQIIVAADTLGSGSEQAVLLTIVDKTAALRTRDTVITADAGYHSEENLRGLCERAVPAMIADGLMRKRDPRFADQARHKAKPDPLYDKTTNKATVKFLPKDFIFEPVAGSCVCPAGKRLYSTGSACVTNGRKHHKFQGAKRDCVPCELRARCLRHPERTPTRQVAFFENNPAASPYTQIMRRAIDSERGKALYGRRIATVEPVFANLRYNKRLDRFTLRTQRKVNTQWHLYCLVHNIEKLARHGYGERAASGAMR